MILQAKCQSRLFQSSSFMLQALVVILGSFVLAATAQISLPWQPVPLTFQSAMVVMLGLTLGSKRAALAATLYLAEAALGMPVLAGFVSGPAALLGPTAGYLFAFVPAAFLAGFLMESGMAKSLITVFLTSLFCSAVIFLFGVAHLSGFIGMQNALAFGLTPFLFAEPVKLLIASMLATFCWK